MPSVCQPICHVSFHLNVFTIVQCLFYVQVSTGLLACHTFVFLLQSVFLIIVANLNVSTNLFKFDMYNNSS